MDEESKLENDIKICESQIGIAKKEIEYFSKILNELQHKLKEITFNNKIEEIIK